MRLLHRNHDDTQRQKIQTEHEELTGLILQLKQAQQMAGVLETNILTRADHGSLDIWDSLVNDMLIASAESIPVDGPAHHNTPVPANPLPIEDTIIALPSNGNMGNAHQDLELANQILLADHHLNQIRDIVAEKSFQYSNVIRVYHIRQ